MKRKLISMLLCFTLLFSLSACQASSKEEPAENTASLTESESTEHDDTDTNTDTTTDTEEDGNLTDTQENTEESEKAVLSIDYASEDLLANPDSYHECIVTESDWQVKAVITTNIPIKNLKVVSLNYEDLGADGATDSLFMKFQIAEELYSLDELTAEKPLVIGMEFSGIVPTLGITYIDENYTQRLFAIDMSGENDTLLLTESKIVP